MNKQWTLTYKTGGVVRSGGILCLLLFLAMHATAKKVVVAKDGSGNFTTIQAAINAIDTFKTEPLIIFIKNGIYTEKVVVPATVTKVSFVGESREYTVITNSDYSGKFMHADTVNYKEKFGTFNSYTMEVLGSDITLENLTIKNESGRKGQAVALHAAANHFAVKNCSLEGNQDTLYTANEKALQYYLNCEISGTTDFIFGNATAVFDRCIIKSLTNSYITAASTSPQQVYGYVFTNCKLEATPEATSVYLGRPWRPNAKVVFLNSTFGKHIRKEGWHNWGKTENEATAFYAEYNNTGDGADTTDRVPWSHQLNAAEAKAYTINQIFGDWKPNFSKK